MRFVRALFILTILATFVLLLNNFKTDNLSKDTENLSFDELKNYFSNLSKEKGAKEAFEVLKEARVSPNTDMHLLGHVVGDILYEQQGAEGIKICTQDFRNACSHSIVVGLFTDKGEDALALIQEACKKAPGGLGAYIMCYHGLGHGILAYTGFDFTKTIDLCKKTATSLNGSTEYPECVSGAVMEIISGGGHSRELWAIKRPEYLKKDNPFYICSPPFMPEEARGRCYDYITPFLWEALGADIDNPTQEDFQKSFKLCNQVTQENYRNICFGGFGKEFVVLAQSRDIRRIDQMNNDQFRKIVDWCSLAQDNQGISACLSSALNSLYWGGENDRSIAIRFCKIMNNQNSQTLCFSSLIGQVRYYIQDYQYRESFCKELPYSLYNDCRNKLSLQ